MKKFNLVLVGLLLFQPLYPQSPEGTDCEEAARRYSEEYIAFLKGEKEEAALLLFQWEQSCGMTEPLFRARALQLLAEGNFPGMLHEREILDMALAFRTRYEIMDGGKRNEADEYFAFYSEYFGHIPFNSEFDRQTIRFARNLIPRYSPGTLEHAFVSLYSGEITYLFELLKQGHFEGTSLSEEYFERVSFYQRKAEFNFGLTTGLWIPDSELSLIGNKPMLGVFVGMKKSGFYLNGVFEMRFGKTREPFTMALRDTLVETNNHHGGFLGVEVAKIFWSSPGKRIQLGAGIAGGYDIIDMVEDTQSPVRQTFGSFSFRAGPVVEYHTAGRLRIIVIPQWSYLSHTNERGSSLNGNAFSISIGVGMTDNPRKWQNLRRLGY